jgi:hypothetical protein
VFITPYELTVNLWHATLPIYEWVAEPAAATIDSAAGTGVGGDAGASEPVPALPRMRLVFRGLQTAVFPVWTSRENMAWEQAAQSRRDEDEGRNDEGLRALRAAAIAAPSAVDSAADVSEPPGPDGSPGRAHTESP